MPGEDAHLAQALVDLIAAVDLRETAVETLMGEVRRDVLQVPARSGLLDRRHAEIGSEDLHREGRAGFVQVFLQGDGDREGLFARGATRHPDANRLARRPYLE